MIQALCGKKGERKLCWPSEMRTYGTITKSCGWNIWAGNISNGMHTDRKRVPLDVLTKLTLIAVLHGYKEKMALSSLWKVRRCTLRHQQTSVVA
ncbi:unnamed protein product [Caenorhabditis nigoni]